MKTKSFIIALAVLAVYSYGWKVTEINVGELFRDFHLVKPLVKELVSPDLFTREKKSQIVEAEFFLSQNHRENTPRDNESMTPMLVLSRQSGEISDRITVHGFNLKPAQSGVLYWVNAIEQEFPLGTFATDSSGAFQGNIIVPPSARGLRQTVKAVISWEEGAWQISDTLSLTFEKMVETVFLALMATTFGVLVAVPLSFLGARNLMTGSRAGTFVYYVVRTGLNILRSIEPLIMAILFVVWVGIGPFAGVLALGLHSVAALGKLFSEQIECIDPGPVEAVTAVGAKPVQVVFFGVLPQVILPFMALSFYRWDINVRMSTIIGFVGGGGIGFLLQQWINLLKYNEAGTALLAIAIVVITLDTLSSKIRARVR
ncbi:MAG: phosphonate ABC transporter, permease protein PhnE [Nitrospinae bacterium]|nr:phosphonate ABC transporter, permease protein PhnE [Nitrospinota bacterium]MBL7019482.1 phosphonate ABC transporter, permease protein PhnE [Nitrospinaceae bacterium]